MAGIQDQRLGRMEGGRECRPGIFLFSNELLCIALTTLSIAKRIVINCTRRPPKLSRAHCVPQDLAHFSLMFCVQFQRCILEGGCLCAFCVSRWNGKQAAVR